MDDDLERWRRALQTADESGLRQEFAALFERYERLQRRLDRILKISDGFQHQLRETHQSLQKTQQQLAEELRDAAEYLENQLPEPIDFPVRIRWIYQPCAHLGGDALGFRVLPGGERVAFYVLDVCGHGLRSALLSISLLGALRAGGMVDAVAHNPAAVLSALNLAFPASVHGGLFTSMWYGVYDIRTNKLTFASAGHPPALFVSRTKDLQIIEMGAQGTFLGILPDTEFTNVIRRVEEPGRLFVFSDGACEVFSPEGKLLASEDFDAILSRVAHLDDPLAAFAQEHAEWRRGGALSDDCSMLEIELGANPNPIANTKMP